MLATARVTLYVRNTREGKEEEGGGLVGTHYSTVGRIRGDSSRGWWGVIATARVTLYVRNTRERRGEGREGVSGGTL